MNELFNFKIENIMLFHMYITYTRISMKYILGKYYVNEVNFKFHSTL